VSRVIKTLLSMANRKLIAAYTHHMHTHTRTHTHTTQTSSPAFPELCSAKTARNKFKSDKTSVIF